MAHIVTTDLGASLKRLVHTESRALIAALSSQTSATSLDASARTLSHALQLTCALLACSGPTHGTQMHIDGASQHKTGSNEDYMGVCVSWAVAVADVATHQLFAASPTSHSSHASRASRKGQAARGQGSVAPCSTVVTAVGALQQSVVGCEVIQLLLGLHGHLVVQQVCADTSHGCILHPRPSCTLATRTAVSAWCCVMCTWLAPDRVRVSHCSRLSSPLFAAD